VPHWGLASDCQPGTRWPPRTRPYDWRYQAPMPGTDWRCSHGPETGPPLPYTPSLATVSAGVGLSSLQTRHRRWVSAMHSRGDGRARAPPPTVTYSCLKAGIICGFLFRLGAYLQEQGMPISTQWRGHPTCEVSR
jgi:hypothetical protein